jgi:hypothetical protein
MAYGIEYSEISNSPARFNNKLEDNMIHNDKTFVQGRIGSGLCK